MDTSKRILMIGKYCGDSFEWHVPPPPVEEPADGTLQDVIDIANADVMAEEWADDMADHDFWARGQW